MTSWWGDRAKEAIPDLTAITYAIDDMGNAYMAAVLKDRRQISLVLTRAEKADIVERGDYTLLRKKLREKGVQFSDEPSNIPEGLPQGRSAPVTRQEFEDLLDRVRDLERQLSSIRGDIYSNG